MITRQRVSSRRPWLAGARRYAVPVSPDRFTADGKRGIVMSGIVWIVLIGLVAGVVARFVYPGPNNPSGFILTTALGIAGAFVATFIGQSIGWYRIDQGAGFIGATVGALIVLFIWNRLAVHRVVRDPGISADRGTPPSWPRP
jgi:uncharacterized membrane protein YeaQ/YmgE (transglycosylase-associated protein family)